MVSTLEFGVPSVRFATEAIRATTWVDRLARYSSIFRKFQRRSRWIGSTLLLYAAQVLCYPCDLRLRKIAFQTTDNADSTDKAQIVGLPRSPVYAFLRLDLVPCCSKRLAKEYLQRYTKVDGTDFCRFRCAIDYCGTKVTQTGSDVRQGAEGASLIMIVIPYCFTDGERAKTMKQGSSAK